MVQILEIQQKIKAHPNSPASLEDFAYARGEHIEAEIILRSPCISLYCVDDKQRLAIFVQTPESVDLTPSPFYYQAQYAHAQRLLAISYGTLHHLAAQLPAGDLPLVLLYSVGRTGSTLLSKAFGALGTVYSLSEPDIYTQAVRLRLAAGGARDDEVRALLASSTRLLLAPAAHRGAAVGVLKFRSPCIEIADLLGQAFPQARNLFLYRDLAAWLPSAAAMFGIFEEDAAQQLPGLITAFAGRTPLLAARLQEPGEPPTAVEFVALLWLAVVQRYLAQQRAGAWYALRYEDLVAQPAQTLQEVLAFVGLPPHLVDSALQAYAQDAQEGTGLSRAALRGRARRELTEQEKEQVREVVQRYFLAGPDRSIPAQIASSATI
jgi:hypothetical protein